MNANCLQAHPPEVEQRQPEVSVCLCKQHLANISSRDLARPWQQWGTECLLCQPGRAGAAAAGLGEDFRRKAVRAALITEHPQPPWHRRHQVCSSLHPAVSVPFVWRVPSSAGTLGFAVCGAQGAPAQGMQPGAAVTPGVQPCPGAHGSGRAAAGIAPGKLMHFCNLAFPPTPRAFYRGTPFL